MRQDLQAASDAVPALLEEVREWVDIDSGSHDKAGVDQVGARVQARLTRAGCAVEVHPQQLYGDNLVARRAGAGTLRLLLIGHMDTVYPRGAVAARPFVIRFHWAFSVSAAIAAIGVFTSLTRGKDK
jgi:glutamate carboxypeptidase